MSNETLKLNNYHIHVSEKYSKEFKGGSQHLNKVSQIKTNTVKIWKITNIYVQKADDIYMYIFFKGKYDFEKILSVTFHLSLQMIWTQDLWFTDQCFQLLSKLWR